MQLYHLVYQSQASHPFTSSELGDLLQQALPNNQQHDITGILLYTPDGQFMQLLEGPKTPVEATYARIAQDPRHQHCRIRMAGPWSKRSFTEWHIGLPDCALLPAGLPAVCLSFEQVRAQLPAMAPTRPMLVYTLLEFIEPHLR